MRGGTPSLDQIADGCWAWTQPDGSWGYSNAGLVTDGGASLLVDTLYDLRLTRAMAERMRRDVPGFVGPGAIVNTHANGDHCYGNGAFPGVPIVASEAAAREMPAFPPAAMARAVRALRVAGRLPWPLSELRIDGVRLRDVAEFFVDAFGAFEFDGVELVLPDTTFRGELSWRVGDRAVELIEVGPAHTAGDVVAWVPDARVVYTGDILFSSGHPIVWEGPLRGWVGACDRILALDPAVVVPGHGPLATVAEVRRLRDHLTWLWDAVRARYEAGLGPADAAADLALDAWADWGEAERVVVNVDAIYRELRGDHVKTSARRLMAMMAEARRRARGRR